MQDHPTAGEVVTMVTAPVCVFCAVSCVDRRARYDFRTRFGSWAYGCEEHWQMYRATKRLGIGYGQRLVAEEEA